MEHTARLIFEVTINDSEIQAIEVICTLLNRLEPEQVERVLAWASSRFRSEED